MVSTLEVKEVIEFSIVFVISIAIFEIAMQPVLVFINPMFADKSVPMSGRFAPDTPAGWALLVTVILSGLLYVFLLRPHLTDIFSNRSP